MIDTIGKISLWLIGIITSIHCIMLEGVWFFSFLLKAIYFQTLDRLFFYFFITYHKLFVK